MWGASPNVVEALIRAFPEGLDDNASGDIKGRTPRHYAARFPHLTSLLERSTADWKLIAVHGGGYLELYIPFCGHAVLE